MKPLTAVLAGIVMTWLWPDSPVLTWVAGMLIGGGMVGAAWTDWSERWTSRNS